MKNKEPEEEPSGIENLFGEDEVMLNIRGIELPQASQEAGERDPTTIEISIDAQGRYYINGRRLVNTQMSTLKQGISGAAGDQTEPPILLSADAKTPHQAVIQVMDAVSQLGFSRLSFAAQATSESQ